MRPLAILFCCFVLVAILCGCRSSHDTEVFYAARTDAEKNGEFDRGWLPEVLPKSTHSIYLAYDVSPSTVWCVFEFDPADANAIVNNAQPLGQPVPSLTRVPRPRVKWWPKLLEGNLDLQKIHGAGLVLYSVSRPVSQVENETLLFAIDRTSGRGYFYGH
jgi:hypothetical protein